VNQRAQFASLFAGPPILALAPMQAITDLPFWRLITAYGGADLYVTEYFRVHSVSRLNKGILRSITENPTGRPVIGQLIGNDIPALVRSAQELQRHPVAAVDLNLGCPAPVVYRKCAGGGLLRTPDRIDAILGALRAAITIPFTVKTRVGFDSPREFEQLLPVFARHDLDMLAVHGRTVKEVLRPGVHYGLIAQAAATLPYPVLANGDIDSAAQALKVWRQTGAKGIMIGRGAVRNPWIFNQIRQALREVPVFHPTGRDLLNYLERLYEALWQPGFNERSHLQMLKKHLNFVGQGLPDPEPFLHDMRRVSTRVDFQAAARRHLDHDRPAFTG
jgi:tRNA-dihydrouridine synthase